MVIGGVDVEEWVLQMLGGEYACKYTSLFVFLSVKRRV
jgi:hypothetical protein